MLTQALCLLVTMCPQPCNMPRCAHTDCPCLHVYTPGAIYTETRAARYKQEAHCVAVHVGAIRARNRPASNMRVGTHGSWLHYIDNPPDSSSVLSVHLLEKLVDETAGELLRRVLRETEGEVLGLR